MKVLSSIAFSIVLYGLPLVFATALNMPPYVASVFGGMFGYLLGCLISQLNADDQMESA